MGIMDKMVIGEGTQARLSQGWNEVAHTMLSQRDAEGLGRTVGNFALYALKQETARPVGGQVAHKEFGPRTESFGRAVQPPMTEAEWSDFRYGVSQALILEARQREHMRSAA